MPPRPLARIGAACVACGACVNLCPVGALSVPKGLRSVVDPGRCVGCGKCARGCAAGIIEMIGREGGEDA